MSSPKISKMYLELEDGLSRIYEWEKEKLTMAELVVMINMTGKLPDKTSWAND